MVYYDIHTHHLPVHPEDAAIVNSLVPTFDVGMGLFRSVGIHPGIYITWKNSLPN